MSTYNGYTNYETWNIGLWLDNDQGSQEMIMDMARQYRGDENGLAAAIKDLIEENRPEVDGMYADLLGAAIDSANFYELAEGYLETLDENEPEETDDEETEEA